MIRRYALVLGTLGLLTACGQRGGLYLPGQRPSEVQKTAPPEPAANPADEDKKKNK